MSKVIARDIKRKTPEEITTLARQVITKERFVTNDEHIIDSAFYMIMSFVDITEAATRRMGALIGDMGMTVPGLGMNGYPIFLSVAFLHKDDVKPLRQEIDRMYAAMGLPA